MARATQAVERLLAPARRSKLLVVEILAGSLRGGRGYFFLRPRLIGMRSVRVVLGLVFARDFFTNRPVIAERTAVVNRCLATTGV